MSHGMIAAKRLRETIIRLGKQEAFDRDAYSEAEKLLNDLDRYIADRNKQQVDVTLSKIARLLTEQTCMNQETER